MITGVVAIGGVFLPAATDPLADLKAGAAALEAKRYPAAIASLESIGKRLPLLADYAAWFLASAQFESRNYAAAAKALEPVWVQTPPSPLTPRAALLAARAWGETGEAQRAVDLLRKYYAALPQPQGDLAMAAAFAGAGDSTSAAIYFQRVYYGYPLSAEASTADFGLAKLRAQLGDNLPPAMPNAMLGRALKLLEANQPARARKELEALVPQLGGVERDLARVRIGVAQYTAQETPAARRYLASLEVSSPDADAERLYYLLLGAQRLNNQEEASDALERLGRLYPNSSWRMQALVASANHYLLQNQMEAYEPLFRACYESFPNDLQAAVCHWKVTWGHYLRRRTDSSDLLRAHLRLFPASDQASAALYFLGRLAEEGRDLGSARAYYDEIAREYPNLYYGGVARERLEQLGAVAPSRAASEFLRGIGFPARMRTRDFEPGPLAKSRIERAKMLVSAGLKEWAETELRFGAQTEDQPHVLAMELASLIGGAKPDQGIRYIKRYASGYVYVPVDSAPLTFWRLAFPLPYQSELERFSAENKVDPFLVAALIRQESEFDPRAVSRSNARGLTQIVPATGRELSRRLNVKTYSTAALFQPTLNLRFGTYYLKVVSDQLGGRVEAALAAYNAGLTRARAWLTWGEFREPSEFIETVPFTETRGYIQTVLRNADVYRRVYGSGLQASTH